MFCTASLHISISTARKAIHKSDSCWNVGDSRPYSAIPVDLIESTLAEAVESTCGRYLAELSPETEGIQEAAEVISSFAALDLHEYTQSVTPLMNLVLYLCSINAEFRDHSGLREKPKQPPMTRTRKGPRMFPPEQPTTWDVGWRLGAALRGTLDAVRRAGKEGSHASPRPHIRRAHWHSYWTGPMAASERSIRVRWMPPVGVRTGNTQAIIPVLRRVLPTTAAVMDESHTRWGVPVTSPGAGTEGDLLITTSRRGRRLAVEMPPA